MSPLDSAWKPGFSLATSVLSALETLWQLRYINSHLPYHTIHKHFQWPLHGPEMLCRRLSELLNHCVQVTDKNSAVSGIFQRWLNMTVPVVAVALTADMWCVRTVPLLTWSPSETESNIDLGQSGQTAGTTVITRVRTDPGKVWKVLEFNVEIFKALKSLENDHRYGKVWKNPWKL